MISFQYVYSYDFIVDGIYYIYNTGNQSATVTSGESNYSGSIQIPSTIVFKGRELKVTDIGEKAFYMNTELKSIIIMSENINIGSYAFYGCTKLKKISAPNNINDIANFSFYDCQSLSTIDAIIGGSLGQYAFANCISLRTIKTENNFQWDYDNNGVIIVHVDGPYPPTMGKYVFSGSGLESICITHKSVGDYALEGCKHLRVVRISNKVEKIGKHIFSGCGNIESVIFEDGDKGLAFLCPSITYGNQNTDYHFSGCNPTYLYLGRNIYRYDSDKESFPPFSFSNLKYLIVNEECKDFSDSKSNPTQIYITTDDTEKVCGGKFNNSTYINATLYVPTGTKEKYMISNPWKNFFDIQEMNVNDMPLWEDYLSSGINKIKDDKPSLRCCKGGIFIEMLNQGDIIQVYNIKGHLLKTTKADNISMFIPLPSSQLYIVKIGAITSKILVPSE